MELQSPSSRAMKDKRPPQLIFKQMYEGNPSLVTNELKTDLPVDILIDNKLTHGQVVDQASGQALERQKFELDSLIEEQKSDSSQDPLMPLQTLVFSPIENQWVSLSVQNLAASTDKVETISMVTYNIWFEEFYREERYAVILKILGETTADFICLQEVVSSFQVKLLSQQWVQERYFVSKPLYSGYGVLMLSKWPCKWYQHQLPTQMGRSLLLGECLINGENVLVSTSHFESLDNPDLRKWQLNSTFPIIKKVNNSFLMGDFNFDSSWKEQENIDPEFDDIYLALNDNQETFTMPKNPFFPQWRPDKILVNKKSDWKATKIAIFGKFGIPSFKDEDVMLIQEDNKVRTPSDHYGLYAIFEYSKQ